MTSDLIALRDPSGSEALFSLYGAQLLSWRSASGDEQLYRSPTSSPGPGRAVRGGTPVCLPQFAERGPLTKHGFARNLPWHLARVDATPALRFELDEVSAPAAWQHAFRFALDARIGPDWLELELEVHNPGGESWQFTGALHTYLAVDDVRGVELHGLQSCEYEDALSSNQVRRQDEEPLRFTGELDCVYRATPSKLLLSRPGQPALHVLQQGFCDTVVWNPGPERAARLGDMPAADWVKMLCVEAAVVQRPVIVEPGTTWRGSQRLELAPAS